MSLVLGLNSARTELAQWTTSLRCLFQKGFGVHLATPLQVRGLFLWWVCGDRSVTQPTHLLTDLHYSVFLNT